MYQYTIMLMHIYLGQNLQNRKSGEIPQLEATGVVANCESTNLREVLESRDGEELPWHATQDVLHATVRLRQSILQGFL